jgi:hypothetical protein
MESALSDRLYSMADGEYTARDAYARKSARDLALDEDWLQSAIQANPELVLGPCRSYELIDDEPWYVWKREYSMPEVGSIDILLVSASGRIGIVETKMDYNPEKRRSVIAQALDYLLALKTIDPDDLPTLPTATGMARAPTMDDVERHLADGDFLLVVAGDRIDSRVARLSRGILGDNLVHPWDLALVEIALFERTAGGAGERLLVPSLVGVVEHQTRHVVRVRVDEDTTKTHVTVETVRMAGEGGGRRRWTREEFLQELDKRPLAPEFKELARGLITLIDESNGEWRPSWGTGQSGSVTAKRENGGIIEIHLTGNIGFRPRKFRTALGDQGAMEYENELRRMFPRAAEMEYPWTNPEEAARGARALLELLGRTLRGSVTRRG